MTLTFLPRPQRALALATVAATSLALSIGVASAQTAPSTATKPDSAKPPAAAAATSAKPETVEQRISMLKTSLKITPDQESKWDKVATAMRENAAAMDKLVKDKQAKADSMTAIDDLKTYQDFTQAHLDGLKNLTSSFKTLYDAMSADQKKNADQVFQAFGGPAKSPQQG